jgi:predicted transcriptional regulator
MTTTVVGRNSQRRYAVSEPTTSPSAGSGQLRTLAVRITEDLRAQLDILAQLTGRSATEEIRLAVEHWIVKTKSDPAILKKAEQVRAEIERKAQTERAAIAAIFGGDGVNDHVTRDRQAARRTKSTSS